MIFISNAEGTIVKVAPSSIQQGTNEGNEIVLFAPFVGHVDLLCILPNGMRRNPIPMTPLFELEETELKYIPESIKSEYIGKSIWRVLLPYAVTEYPGNLQVQFKITIADGDNKSRTIKTSTLNVYINPGYYTEEESGVAEEAIANAAATAARGYREGAEAWAIGTKDNVPIKAPEEDDDTYTTTPHIENNAKYYAEQARESYKSASEAENSAKAWAIGTDDENAEQHENNAKYYAEKASESADDAAAVVNIFNDMKTKLDNVTNVMDFRGAVNELPTDLTNYQDGDVIVVTSTGKEFVFCEGEWIELGNTTADYKAIEELRTGKQDKLPENDGNTTHRMWLLSPLGYINENGEKKPGFSISAERYEELRKEFPDNVKIVNGVYYWTHPYYLKSISTFSGADKNSSNGDIGVVTKFNRDSKVAEGLISKTDNAYKNYVGKKEPSTLSFACRDERGRLVVDDGTSAFHAVNKRQLDKALEGVTAKVEAISPDDLNNILNS